jgi:uncharacterized membrane protein YdjX (TVP38/TMEM64 family)
MPLRLVVVIIGFVAAVAAGTILLPFNVWFGTLQSWVVQLGPAAFVVFGMVYAIATATISPTAPFSIAAGLLFGVAAGLPVAMVSAISAAAAGYYISRRFFRGHIAKIVAKRPMLSALDHAIAVQGWRVVYLVRLSPLVPFSLQNYMLGVTRVRIVPYLLATVAGILPYTALWVYVGAQGQTSLAAAGPAALVLPGIGVICSLLVVALVSWSARRALLKVVAENTS